MKTDHRVKVYFYMWGQECETICANQEDALKWLATVTPKGWCLPGRITTMEGTVLMKNPELNREVDR